VDGDAAALIATVMITRKDFSFLRGVMVWGFFLAIGLIAASLIFGWNLGTWFSVGMIGFAGVAVLYDTSNIMRLPVLLFFTIRQTSCTTTRRTSTLRPLWHYLHPLR